MQLSVLRNKYLWLAIFGISFLLLLRFLLTHSYLTIESRDRQEITVYIRKDGFEERVNLKNDSKKLLLRSGDYQIEAENGEAHSIYQQKLRFLWSSSKLTIETVQPKDSIFLGKNILGCAKQEGSNKPLFYSCRPSHRGLINSGIGSIRNIQVVEDGDYIKPDNSSSLAMRPLNQDFLVAGKYGRDLIIKRRLSSSSELELFTIKSFGDRVDDSVFSSSGKGFSILDKVRSKLYFSTKTHQNNYHSLDLDTDLFVDENLSNVTVVDTSNYTYLLSRVSEEALSNTGNPEGGHSHASKLIIVDKRRQRVVDNINLKEDWSINSMSAGPADSLLILLAGEVDFPAYIVTPKSEVRALKSADQTIQQACPYDDDGFYYLASAGQAIYKYSLSRDASYRVYSNYTNRASSISCLDKKLYFVIVNQKEEDQDLNLHYLLSGGVQVGERLDSVLPVYNTYNQDTFKFAEVPGGVGIDLLYDANKNGVGSKDIVRDRLLRILKDAGVETQNLNIIFGF